MNDLSFVPSDNGEGIAALMKLWSLDDDDDDNDENEHWRMITASGSGGVGGVVLGGEVPGGSMLPTLVTQTLIIPESKDAEAY